MAKQWSPKAVFMLPIPPEYHPLPPIGSNFKIGSAMKWQFCKLLSGRWGTLEIPKSKWEHVWSGEGAGFGGFCAMSSPNIPEDAETLRQTGFADQLFSRFWWQCRCSGLWAGSGIKVHQACRFQSYLGERALLLWWSRDYSSLLEGTSKKALRRARPFF